MVPRPDKTRVVASSTEPERRLVAVLVTDIVDSTPIAERLGAERYKTLFDEIARLCASRSSASAAPSPDTGDGILALFGAPTAPRTTRSARSAPRSRFTRHWGRIAADVAGASASRLRRGQRSIRSRPRASRRRACRPALQRARQHGHRCGEAAGSSGFRRDDLGTVDSPPGRAALPARAAWRTRSQGPKRGGGRLPRHGRARGWHDRSMTRLVGRDDELHALADAARSSRGSGTVVILRGEPGSGSRASSPRPVSVW